MRRRVVFHLSPAMESVPAAEQPGRARREPRIRACPDAHIGSVCMEAHEALSRHEHVSRADDHLRDGLARQAALVVAVIAAFLAVATFMANEAVKEAITGETKAADT